MEPQEIIEIFRERNTSESRDRVVRALIEQNADLKDYFHILYEEYPVGMMFTWTLGALTERAPEMMRPLLPDFFAARLELDILGYDRSLSKWLWLCGIPEEIEGEAAEQLFEWLLDPKVKVAPKVFAMSALADLAKKYPELAFELRTIIEEQMPEGSAGYKSRGRKVLKQLDKIAPRRM